MNSWTKIIGVFWLLTLGASPIFAIPTEDPYAIVRKHQLPNGVTVWLAPTSNAKTVKFEFNYRIGRLNESSELEGVAHLLEHSLFRDSELAEDMTYIQMVDEDGGSLNGTTQDYSTRYYGEIRHEKAMKLLEVLQKVLLDKKFTDAMVEKAKSEVVLEIGEGKPYFSQFLDWLNPLTYEPPGFWQSEFGYEDYGPHIEAAKRNTRNLTRQNVTDFYHSFYHPSNLEIYIAGHFNEQSMIEALTNSFGRSASEKSLLPTINARDNEARAIREDPYSVVKRQSRNQGSINLGTKFWNISLRDELVLTVYVDFLAQRLMKEIRNRNGDTYSARSRVAFYRGSGFAYVYLSVPGEVFKHYLDYVESKIKLETLGYGLSDSEINRAKKRFVSRYALAERDADTLISMAQEIATNQTDYNDISSPLATIRDMPPEEFRDRLQILFQPERAYRVIDLPPFLHPEEDKALALLIAILAITLGRAFLKSGFRHDSVRYVRKVKYSWLTFVKIAVVATCVFAMAALGERIYQLLLSQLNLRGSIFFNHYLDETWRVLFFSISGLAFLMKIPRKIYICDDKLIVKSATYYSHSVPLKNIVSIDLVHAWEVLEKWDLRMHVFHWGIRDPGVLIRTSDGHGWLLGFREPELVSQQLEQYVKLAKSPSPTLAPPLQLPHRESA